MGLMIFFFRRGFDEFGILIWIKFEEFYDLLLDLREDKRIKKAEEERDQMREER